MRARPSLPVSIAACLVLAAGTLTGASLQDPAAPAPPPTATAEVRDLTLRVNLPGRVDSENRRRVVLDLESFGGTVEVTDVLNRSGAVREGDALLEVNTESIDEAIEDAEIALDAARQGLAFAQQEQSILGEANAIRVERATDSTEQAEHGFEIFDRFSGQRMIRSAELRVLQSEYGLADQKEELAQLEKMYDESTLASETKEIVIERNRRQIAISEEYLQFAKDDLLIARDFSFPDQKEAVEDALRFAQTDLQHAILQVQMAEARKVTEVANATRSLADAEERLADLRADRDRLNLAAPASGLLTPITLVAGDQVRGGQMIAEVVDPGTPIVTMSIQPSDLRVLAVGDEVEITFPAFPEVTLTGEVTEIADIGTASGESTVFPVRIALGERNPLVRIGLNCTVHAAQILPDVLLVPAKAVHTEGGRSICYVTRAGGEPEEREVVIGASDGEFVHVVRGLRAGDVILLEKPSEQP